MKVWALRAAPTPQLAMELLLLSLQVLQVRVQQGACAPWQSVRLVRQEAVNQRASRAWHLPHCQSHHRRHA